MLIKANNKYFVIIFTIFALIVICGFLSTIFIKQKTYLINFNNYNNQKYLTIEVKKLTNTFYNGYYVYDLSRDGILLQRVYLGKTFGTNIKETLLPNNTGFELKSENGQIVKFEIILDDLEFSMIHIERKNVKKFDVIRDCFSLSEISYKETGVWFGGPELKEQKYHLNKMELINYDYIPKELNSSAIMERYWLLSNGLFIYVDKNTPLFIEQNQNSDIHPNALCFVAKKELPYYTHDETFSFDYTLGIAGNVRTAHEKAIKHFLNKPTDYPDEEMVRHPIWSTWVRYGRDINETTVKNFANEIIANGFNNSQIEIDDFWETCYGSMEVSANKFPDFKALIDELKLKGFRVTLWIHPFINKNCQPWYDTAMEKNYFVKDHTGNADTKWWNSGENEAAYLDFTNPDTVSWFKENLRDLQLNYGVDSFKFDAGETSWGPMDPKLNSPNDYSPTQMTVDFVRELSAFGKMIEVRTGHMTQDLPVFVRMLDLDSHWGWYNGLITLIPTLIQMNLAGYPFVLPDMIGGNSYNDDVITKELFIRWMQATVFMPTMQFSVPPWRFDEETIELSHYFIDLHLSFADQIITHFKNAVADGTPVNKPIWWIAPTDNTTFYIYDQFLLGDNVLVAPVIEEGVIGRRIYFPDGVWLDGNDRITNYTGPSWIEFYPAPLNILPYFLRFIKT